MNEQNNTAHCIRCDRPIEWYEWATSHQPPSGATVWTTHGNYGSTEYDPMGSGEYMEGGVCDPCFVVLKDRGQIAPRQRSERPVRRRPRPEKRLGESGEGK